MAKKELVIRKRLFRKGAVVKKYKGSGGGVQIPDGVTELGSRAFEGKSEVISVTMPDSLTTIASFCFKGCTGLQSVSISKNLRHIANDAFDGCGRLKALYFRGDLTDWCGMSYMSAKDNLLSYAHNLFLREHKAQSVVIPESVTEVRSFAFCECRSLRSVVCAGSVSHIGEQAFFECRNLTSVTLGASVKRIESKAFGGCKRVSTVRYEGSLAKWCNISFENRFANPIGTASELYIEDKKVVDLIVPDGVTKVKSCTFAGYVGLRSAVIPDSVAAIGPRAFYYCDQLTSITIGTGVTAIGQKALAQCPNLKEIIYTGSEKQWYAIAKAREWDYGSNKYKLRFLGTDPTEYDCESKC